MLDAQTKARIDSARDILVGKVPDPKSQVEQITIALIYKFMDDMDRQSEELGGKASFFTGEFKKYRWAQLLDKRYSGHERLLLYAEGIEKMNQNKNIPQLFRDIFKGVFLPYRDPETLNLFLKEIDGFVYDHSERLGDAFEYLLSVLGTQGNAGQFRTPRHIIDFIVAVVDPKKSETVLDPACGTAGFLISSYKHILKSNETLTPDERARLMSNFRGYDIAPDMVRLSRVNLYLHGFPNPVIHEYDTLTSEERWDERCDVILANPPFMTPKGGIRPHNRFSIKAKRSEVLFVDYIAEHLNPGGRGGVIVPEGIIFQSQNAYKALRRMLVENYLWAVASLPAGVFNPYSGVKTSILFLDRNMAKRVNDILFVKIENDGFDLGAQRRPIEGSQLAEALEILKRYKKAQNAREGKLALTVSRKRLRESSDINLSSERYRLSISLAKGNWPMVKLRDVCEINPSKEEINHLAPQLSVSFVPMAILQEHSMHFVGTETRDIQSVQKGYTFFKDDDLLLAKITPCFENGKLAIASKLVGGMGFGSTEFIVLRPDQLKLKPALLYYFLDNSSFRERGKANMTGSAGQRRVPPGFVAEFDIPLPPIDEQERIVTELEGYRKVIEGARQIIAAYKPSIRIDQKWPKLPLGQISKVFSGGTPAKAKREYWTGSIPWVSPKDMKVDRMIDSADHISKNAIADSAVNLVPRGTVLCVVRSGILSHSFPVALAGVELAFNQDINGIVVEGKRLIGEWLFYVLRHLEKDILARGIKRGGTVHSLVSGFLRELPIPLPPLHDQRRIVEELEAERKLVEANRELIARMEAKIKAKLAEVWGEDEDNAS